MARPTYLGLGKEADIRVGQVTKWSFAQLSQSFGPIAAIIIVSKYVQQWLVSSIPLTTSVRGHSGHCGVVWRGYVPSRTWGDRATRLSSWRSEDFVHRSWWLLAQLL